MEQSTVNIKLHGIEIFEKALLRTSVKDNEIFTFEVSAQAFNDPAKELVVIFTRVVISKQDGVEKIGTITVGVGFHVEGFSTVFKKNEMGELVIPPDLEMQLRSIAISTTRGVMFSEFRGTQLHKAFLPVIASNTMQPGGEQIVPTKKNKTS